MDEWIDLSLRIDAFSMPFPGDESLKIEWKKSFDRDGYNLSILSSTMHLGTHIDFKKHVLDVEEEVDFRHFMGKANVIFLQAKNHILRTSDIIQAYQYIEHKEDILIISTGHELKINTMSYFDYPKFDKDIFRFLKENHIKLLGSDLPSFEYNESDMLDMHKDLLSHQIYLLENLCHLDKLHSHIDFIALPLSIGSIEASMVRAVAKNL
ncbi:cyclase family protein [Mycoplasmatota bacterium]|nr:cyclase family protein [Mycoplasmatota bacterium]